MVESKITKIGIWAGILSGLLALITAIVGIFYWFNHHIEAVVERRIAPYEHVLTAKGLMEDKNYDDAIEELEEAFNGIDPKDISENVLSAILEPYLFAISNSDNPSEHSPDFQKIYPYLRTGIPLFGRHHEQIGWYFLRTMELEKAGEHFEKASGKYSENAYDESANAYWGIAMVHLAEGDVRKALEAAEKAAIRNPDLYGAHRWSSVGDIKKDRRLSELIRIYSPFESAMRQWLEERGKPDIPKY